MFSESLQVGLQDGDNLSFNALFRLKTKHQRMTPNLENTEEV